MEECLRDHGVWADPTTVLRWVQRYAPELDRRGRPARRATNDSSRVPDISLEYSRDDMTTRPVMSGRERVCYAEVHGLPVKRLSKAAEAWLHVCHWISSKGPAGSDVYTDVGPPRRAQAGERCGHLWRG